MNEAAEHTFSVRARLKTNNPITLINKSKYPLDSGSDMGVYLKTEQISWYHNYQ